MEPVVRLWNHTGFNIQGSPWPFKACNSPAINRLTPRDGRIVVGVWMRFKSTPFLVYLATICAFRVRWGCQVVMSVASDLEGYASTVVTLALLFGKRVNVLVSSELATPAELLR